MSKHGSKRRHKMEPKQSYTGSIILSPESSVVSDGNHGGHPYVQYKKNMISRAMDHVSVHSHQSRNKRSKPSRHAPPMLQQSHPVVAFSDAASLNSISTTATSVSHTYKSDAKDKVLSQQNYERNYKQHDACTKTKTTWIAQILQIHTLRAICRRCTQMKHDPCFQRHTQKHQ
eukprot:47012_1